MNSPSTLVSAVVAALIAGWFSLRTTRNEYVNEYFKIVLSRRVNAYEEIEGLIANIKIAVLDKDQRPYHLLFSKDDDLDVVYLLLSRVMRHSLWLSDELFQLTRDLNVLIYNGTEVESGLIEFGKSNYRTIAELRTKIEICYSRDMLNLHNVPEFLKSKKPSDSYTPLLRTQG